MESLTKSTVFRVSDLPNGITAQQLESVINDKLREQEKANINFTVNLVPSPYIDGQSQVALVDFKSGTPQFLSALTKDPLGDWQIEIDETEVITFDRHFHGFTQLYSPERPVSADIIAITGLDGHAYGSWKGKGNLGRMWLRHFLSQDLPHCRTMIYGYDSRLTSHGINTIMDYGREFLEEIKQVRNTPESTQRPLFFIAHSFGGIILAHCLVKIARTFASDHPTITSLLGSTHGILLFAIPHRGLVVDDIRKMLAEDENHPRHTLLQQINMKSDLLTGQLVDFKNLIRDRKIVSFYETKQTRQLEFNTETQSWGRTGKFATTVEMDSAMLQLPDHLEDKIPLHEDHSSIVKFDSKSAQGYRSAIRNLKQFEQEAPLIISSRFNSVQLRLAATPSSTVPFKRDKMFVGREDILERVESIICGMSAISQHNRAALVGIGGIGKSQIAIEYSHRCREHSPETWVFWVHGGNAARFEAGYKKIAERVKLIGWEKPNTNILELVSDWLSDEANGRWIMIIDNADDAGVFLHLPNKNRDADENRHKHTTRYVSDFLPQTSNGSILITSRNRDAAYSLLGNYSDIISVTPMGQGDALSLLQKLAKYGIDDVIALELLEELDYIPLAIGQAAAYIGQRSPRVTVSTYLDEFRRSETSRARLLEIDSGDDRRDGRASNSIISTWQISFEHIRQTNPRAARLLSLMSLFDRQGIPVSLLKNYYQRQFDNDKNPESKNPLKRRRSDSNPLSQRNQRNQRSVSNPRPDSECRRESDKIETEFEDDIHILRSYSLVADMTETTFEMHRLVQFSTKKWLEVNNRLEELKEAYIKIIDDASPSMSYDIETQKLCQKLFPHMVLILTYRPINDNCLEQWASVLSKTAWHALAIRDYSMGEKIAKQAIEAYEKLGLQNLTTLRPMFDLARAYHAQEKWKEGLELITKMELYTELLGKGHPARISTFNMVARFYMNQNQLDKAEELLMEAFGEMPTEFGREHPLSLDIRTSLAWIYCRKDQLEKAENMHLQVLETRRRVLGKGSLLTASSMQDLGFVYVKQERWNEAEKLYMESLEINRRVFGPDDRGLVENMESLGYVLNKQEQWTKAEMLHRRVLEIRERELGSEHTLTLKTMDHLQVAYMGQKKYKMAEELVKKIFEIQKKTLGPEDEKTLFTMLHLSSILWSQKCRDEALELLVPCVTMSIDTLGGSHPHTLARISVLNTVDQG